MSILIDTSVLLAAGSPKDKYHVVAVSFFRSIQAEQKIVLLPVLIELFHITRARLDYDQAVKLVNQTHKAFSVFGITDDDIDRITAIQQKYRDAKLDFTDAAIMAVSERLNITRIATFDRRDFDIYRPSHTDHYELLP